MTRRIAVVLALLLTVLNACSSGPLCVLEPDVLLPGAW
jgi:hypothetical protein